MENTWHWQRLLTQVSDGRFNSDTLSKLSGTASLPPALRYGATKVKVADTCRCDPPANTLLASMPPMCPNCMKELGGWRRAEKIPHEDLNRLRDAVNSALDAGFLRAALIPGIWRAAEVEEPRRPSPARGTSLCGSESRAERPGWTVVIPVRGAYDALRVCLEAVRAAAPRRIILTSANHETATVIAVVDEVLGGGNEYEDGAVYVAGTDAGTFAVNCNRGAEIALDLAQQGRYASDSVLFLNSDAVIPPWIFGSFDQAFAHGFRAVGPMGTNVSGFQNVRIELAEGAVPPPIDAAFVREINVDLQRLQQGASIMPVPAPRLVGFALAVDLESFLSVGGFEESYGNNFEDDDLSLKLIAAYGPQALGFLTEVLVGHQGGASFREIGEYALADALTAAQEKYDARWAWMGESLIAALRRVST